MPRTSIRAALVAVATAALVVGCSAGSASPTPAPSSAPSITPSSAPSAAPSSAPSAATSQAPTAQLPGSCKDAKPKIGVSLPNTTNPYYVQMQKGFEETGASLGFDVVVAVANDDVTTQLSQVGAFVQQGVCAVGLNPISSGPGAAMAATLSKAGIPVFTVNVSVDAKTLAAQGGQIVQYIGADQTGGGQLLAQQVLKDFAAKAKIVAGIVGFPAAEVTNQRDSGFSTVLLAGDPNAAVPQIVDGKVVPDVSLQVTSQMLQGNPDMNVIFADTGPAAVGALQAIKQLGKSATVKLYAFCAADTKVASPYMACAGQEPYDYGKLVMENIQKYIGGSNVPAEILRPTPIFLEGQTPPSGIIG
jgi:ribose transport system substrate-binding protein